MRKQSFQKAFGDSAYAALTRCCTDLFSIELDKQLVHPVAENFAL